MTSSFVGTPLGNLPKQENFELAGIFNMGGASVANYVSILERIR